MQRSNKESRLLPFAVANCMIETPVKVGSAADFEFA